LEVINRIEASKASTDPSGTARLSAEPNARPGVWSLRSS